jgi:hypothetical protein
VIAGGKPVVTADFMFCFSFKIGFEMLFTEMLPGVFLEKHRFPPALVTLHSPIHLIWTIKDV